MTVAAMAGILKYVQRVVRKTNVLFIFFSFIFINTAVLGQENAEPADSVQQSPPAKKKENKKEAIYRNAELSFLKEYDEAYYLLSKLNVGFEDRPGYIHLQTPQAVLEHFITSCREEDYKDAAFALNMNLLPAEIQETDAEILAEKFYYVLTQRININWDDLPDRPDGQVDISTPSNAAVAGKPRKSILFGTLTMRGRKVPLRVERVKVNGHSPHWVISANTVEHIETMYQEFGPNELDRLVPDWGKTEVFDLPLWEIIGIILLVVFCFFTGRFTRFIIRRSTGRSENSMIMGIGERMATPAALFTGFFLFYLLMNHALSISGSFAPFFYSILLVIVVSAFTWMIMRGIDYFMGRLAAIQQEGLSDEENEYATNYLTYISVARRLITFIIIIVGIGVILSQFPSLQNLGISLMASAGLATILLGIAAQSTLGNIIAGMQIAITKPVTIGDIVNFENEYGAIEDVRFTYLVIRTWDKRRLVVPLQYFITHPFQNWTMTSKNTIRPISLFADFNIDVDKVRDRFIELIKEAEQYDEQTPPTVQVVSSTKDAIEIRALCSAKDPATAWELHCFLREKMIRYIADLENGNVLAKDRVELQEQHLEEN